jgi:hypothetical protein
MDSRVKPENDEKRKFRHSGLACHGVASAKTGSGIHAFGRDAIHRIREEGREKMDSRVKPENDEKRGFRHSGLACHGVASAKTGSGIHAFGRDAIHRIREEGREKMDSRVKPENDEKRGFRHSGLACHGVASAKTGSGIHAFGRDAIHRIREEGREKMDSRVKPENDEKRGFRHSGLACHGVASAKTGSGIHAFGRDAIHRIREEGREKMDSRVKPENDEKRGFRHSGLACHGVASAKTGSGIHAFGRDAIHRIREEGREKMDSRVKPENDEKRGFRHSGLACHGVASAKTGSGIHAFGRDAIHRIREEGREKMDSRVKPENDEKRKFRHSGLACHGVASAKTGSGIHAFEGCDSSHP